MEKAINIGAINAEKLRKIGIETLEELRAMGSKEAFMQIKTAVDPEACLHMLYALEGAIQNIHKKELSIKDKSALKQFYNGVSVG